MAKNLFGPNFDSAGFPDIWHLRPAGYPLNPEYAEFIGVQEFLDFVVETSDFSAEIRQLCERIGFRR